VGGGGGGGGGGGEGGGGGGGGEKKKEPESNATPMQGKEATKGGKAKSTASLRRHPPVTSRRSALDEQFWRKLVLETERTPNLVPRRALPGPARAEANAKVDSPPLHP